MSHHHDTIRRARPPRIRSRTQAIAVYRLPVIPNDWREHRRADDDELMGYLAPGSDGVQPHTVFGYPLGAPTDEHGAALRLDSIGLACLADQWMLRVDGRDQPIAVQVVEASPHGVTVQNVDLFSELDYGATFRLETPVDPERISLARPIS